MQVRCKHALRPELGRGSSCRTNSHPSRKKRKEAATMDASTTQKHSTAQRSCWPQHRGQGTQNAKNETAAPDITPDELAPAWRHLIWAT